MSTRKGAYYPSLIPAKDSPTEGATYEFTDTNLKINKTYWYKLEDVDNNGKSTMHGPVSAMPKVIYGIERYDTAVRWGKERQGSHGSCLISPQSPCSNN